MGRLKEQTNIPSCTKLLMKKNFDAKPIENVTPQQQSCSGLICPVLEILYMVFHVSAHFMWSRYPAESQIGCSLALANFSFCQSSGPMVQHYCHGLTISIHPKPVADASIGNRPRVDPGEFNRKTCKLNCKLQQPVLYHCSYFSFTIWTVEGSHVTYQHSLDQSIFSTSSVLNFLDNFAKIRVFDVKELIQKLE